MFDWAKTWWEASVIQRFKIAKIVLFRYTKWLPRWPSCIQDGRHLLLNQKFDWAKTWWEASQWHRDSKLLKSFCSDIQDGHQGGHLEILQTTSPPKPYVRLSWDLMGGISVRQKLKTAIIFPFQYPRWPPQWPSWNSSNVRLSRNLMRSIRVKWRFRIAELFSSSIQDDSHGSNLETLQTTSDSELLKVIWSDNQDGHHGTM